MANWLKKALTREITIKTTQKRKTKTITIQPSQKLIIGIKFTIATTLTLTTLQIAHMAFVGRWNSKIFACILGLIGTVSGVLISQHA